MKIVGTHPNGEFLCTLIKDEFAFLNVADPKIGTEINLLDVTNSIFDDGYEDGQDDGYEIGYKDAEIENNCEEKT